MIDLHHIVAATDFGPSSLRALELAVDLAKRYDARLTLLHALESLVAIPYFPVGPPPDLLATYREAAETSLAAQAKRVRPAFERLETALREGDPVPAVLAFAKENGAGMILVGSHGYRGVTRFMLGSVAEKLVRLSPVPVTVVRGEG